MILRIPKRKPKKSPANDEDIKKDISWLDDSYHNDVRKKKSIPLIGGKRGG